MQHGTLVLQHAGVKGMKWGKRKARPGFVERSTTRGQSAIAKSGGNSNRALRRIAGRQIVAGLVMNIGSRTLGSLTKNDMAAGMYAAAAMGLAGTAVTTINARSAIDVVNARNANKAGA